MTLHDMTLHELNETLALRDIKLSLQLVIDAPRGALTDAVKTDLAAHKPALLARLGRDAQWEQLAAQRWGPAQRRSNPRHRGRPTRLSHPPRRA